MENFGGKSGGGGKNSNIAGISSVTCTDGSVINKKIGEIKHVDAAFSSSLTDLFQGIPLSESNNHTFQPHASTWSDPNKGGGYGWGQLSHMFAGVLKITHLEPDQVFCLSVPSPTNVDYTNAVSMKFSNGATGSFSGSAFVPKDFGGTFYIAWKDRDKYRDEEGFLRYRKNDERVRRFKQ